MFYLIDEKVLGQGHNQRVQRKSPILHGEMDCLENAGRLSANVYSRATIYTTLSPCSMCSGAILLYGISRVVIGENVNFVGSEALLRENGVELVIVDDADCKQIMSDFIRSHPTVWNEDIGEEDDASVDDAEQ